MLNRMFSCKGAQAFTDLGLADDQHDWGADAVVDSWSVEMWKNLLKLYPSPTNVGFLSKS